MIWQAPWRTTRSMLVSKAPAPMLPQSWQLTSSEVHVWCIDLDVPGRTSARLYATLSGLERSRSARFRFERDRRRFIVAHGALRDLLARYLQTRPESIRYIYNAFGKPDVSPQFGSRLKFNLSHSAGLAVVAVTADSNVGIDLEHIRAQPDLNDIARIFFASAEVDYLTTLPSHLRTEAFFSCWTKKEACVKARGLTIHSHSFSVPPTAHSVQIPRGSQVARKDSARAAERWSLYTLRPAPGYIGALAIEGARRCLSQRTWKAPRDLAPRPPARSSPTRPATAIDERA